ncbi:MAG TPA: hypothetical protein VG298_12755 [Acidimicrobiales bacterium]|nr:hypothetical protein [Acidimicrobiales bacterium]
MPPPRRRWVLPDGYVANVVYSWGAIRHAGTLVIPAGSAMDDLTVLGPGDTRSAPR